MVEESISSNLASALTDFVRDTVREELRLHQLTTAPPLDSNEAAARLNVSRRTLETLIAERKLRPLRIGRKRLFHLAQLQAFLRECEVPTRKRKAR